MTGRIRTVMIREAPLKRLGDLVTAARMATQGPKGKPHTRTSEAKAMSLSRATLIKVEDGVGSAADETYAIIEAFFKWEAGSITRYLRDPAAPEPGAGPRSENLLDLGDESLSDLDVPTLLGGWVAEWNRRVSPSRRNHAAKMVMDFIKSHPNGGDAGD